MIMWLLAIAGVFACYFISEKKKNPRKFFLISAGIVIVLIFGSRYFVNGFTDESAYNYVYQGYSNLSFSDFINLMWGERDFGFYLTYWLMSHIVPWSQFPIYFITALFVFATFRFIYKNTNGTLIPVMTMFGFGIFSFYMAAYRQCFAMCLCIFAFEFAKKKGLRGLLPYAALMLLASTMHISSIIFIPVYFLVRIKNNGVGYAMWAGAIVTILLASTAIMTFASELLEDDDLIDRLEFSSTGLLIQMIIMAVPFVVAFFRLSALGDRARLQYTLMVLVSAGMMFLGFKFVFYTYERISYYYSFFVIGAFSNAICNLNHKKGEKNFVMPIQIVVVLLLFALTIVRIPGDFTFFFQG